MVFKSVEELCDAFLKCKLLQSSDCAKLLQPPVATVDGCRTVCSMCFRQNYSDAENATANEAIDSLLGKLDFACDYAGCSDRITITDYPIHVEYCSYRNMSCEVDLCTWRGPRKAYLEHCAKHELCVVTADSFDIVGLQENRLITNIVLTSCGGFVVHAMLTEDSYCFWTYEIGHKPKLSKFEVFIKCSLNSQNAVYTMMCEVLHSNKVLDSPDRHKAANVKKEFLEDMLSFSELSFRWELNVDNALVLLDTTRVIEKCYRCGDYLRFGADIDVSEDINICILCFLEARKCKCQTKKPATITDLQDHISICPTYTWDCLFCDKVVTYLDHNSHMEAEHQSAYIDCNEIYVTDPVPANDTKFYYIRNFGRIFQIRHAYIDKTFVTTRDGQNVNVNYKYFEWCVHHIGPKDNRFMYEIEICSDNNKYLGKSFLIRNECQYGKCNCGSITEDKKTRIPKKSLNELVTDGEKYVCTVRIMTYKQ